MKFDRTALLILILGFTAFNVGTVNAQDNLNIDEVKRQFAAAKGAAKPEVDSISTLGESAALDADADLDQANNRLIQAEAELLKELQAQKQAPQDGSTTSQVAPDASANELVRASAEAPQRRIPAAAERSLTSSTQVLDSTPSNPADTRDALPSADFATQKLHNELVTQSKEAELLKTTNADLSKKLSTSEAKITQLKAEVDRLKGKLMLSETEVERLSRVLEERNRFGIAAARGQPAPAQTTSKQTSSSTASTVKRSAPAPAQRAAPSEDVMVVTVSADKAYLRTGPGAQNSPLMAISKGTRLVVETMQGEWYRVLTPKGDRAWINRDVIFFNNNRGSDLSSGGTLRIRGIDAASSRDNSRTLGSMEN